MLAAAVQVLERDGRDRLSLRDLARQVGVSHAAPARHFPDRDALLDALAEHALVELGDAIEQSANGAPTTFEGQFTAFALAYTDYAADHPALVALMNERKDRPDAPDLNEQARRTFARPVAAVAAARANGELRDPAPGRLEDVLQAVLDGLALLAVQRRDQMSTRDTVRATVRVLLQGLHADAANPTRQQKVHRHERTTAVSARDHGVE